MARLIIDFEHFNIFTDLFFDEMGKRGIDGCVIYQGVEHVVKRVNLVVTDNSTYPITTESSKTFPSRFFYEMRKLGLDACILYRGHEFSVQYKDAANDSEYYLPKK